MFDILSLSFYHKWSKQHLTKNSLTYTLWPYYFDEFSTGMILFTSPTMLLIALHEVLNGIVKFSFLSRPTPLLFLPFSVGSPAALQSFLFPFSWKRIAWLLYDSHFTARDNSGRLRACLIVRECVYIILVFGVVRVQIHCVKKNKT